MTRLRIQGFTLPELLVTLVVLAVVLSATLPRLDGLLSEYRADSLIAELGLRMEAARKQALIRAQTVTLCPGRTACGGRDDWLDGALLFVDPDNDGTIGDDSHILRRFPPLGATGGITWRSFGNRAFVQFAPNGLTPNQSGRLTYCPESRDARFARQLILNASGRARLATDSDGDGLVETRDGTPVAC